MDYIRDLIRDIPDFPKEGILFKDITPVLSDIKALRLSIEEMSKPFMNQKIDVVVGIESRGFIFGTPIADKLDAIVPPNLSLLSFSPAKPFMNLFLEVPNITGKPSE